MLRAPVICVSNKILPVSTTPVGSLGGVGVSVGWWGFDLYVVLTGVGVVVWGRGGG